MATYRFSTKFRNLLLDKTAGKSWGKILDYGIIYMYTGGMPVNADAIETGTLLAKITLASGSFAFGATANGLRFADAVNAGMLKPSGDTWSGDGLATGVAGWGRFHENDGATGASTTKARMDFDIALTGAVYNMGDTDVVVGAPVTITSGGISLPTTFTF